MIGYTLSFLHSLREIVRKSITPAGLSAYEQFQAHYDGLKAEAQARHARVRDIDAERKTVLHRALRGS